MIWTYLVEHESPLLYTMIQPQSVFGSGEEYFMCILPYMGIAAILFNDAGQFEQVINASSTEGPIWNLVKIGRAVSEREREKKKDVKKLHIFYMYIAKGQGQISPGGQNIYCNWKGVPFSSNIVRFSHQSFICFEKMIFQHFLPYKFMGKQILKKVKVNLWSSFEQTM